MFVETLIKSIVANKDMPKVQVEREISPILELFLVDVFNSLGKKEVKGIEKGQYLLIGAEFPLSIDETERSTNIDYLMFNKCNSTLYFVELKTDSSSFDLEQYKKYKKKIIERVEKDNDNEGAGFLYDFLMGLTGKKYGCYKEVLADKYGLLLNNWKEIKKAKLVYIAPEKLIKNAKRRKLEGEKAIGEISFIHFKDLGGDSNIVSEQYQAEWDVIAKHLVVLDDN